MATNGEIPVEDTEMAECDGGEVVTMMDVLKEQQEFEDDANAVLGGSDDKECTYSQGYIKRQAIYACMTCCPDSKDNPSKRAGFCLACSLTCHENHDLVELYTKRNFRCDCGNPKFKSSCQFTPNKPDLNDDNVYSQNFVGLYCICSKPYGDQEAALDDEMIQCVICEDWWHSTHLEAVVPALDQFSEMVCKLCMAKNDFLHSYSDLTVNTESGDVDIINEVDSTIPDEKRINVSIADDKLTNGTVTGDKLTNGSMTDEILTNGSVSDDKLLISATDEEMVNGTESDNKLRNGTEENADSNEMETSTKEAPVIDDQPVISNIDNEASSSEKECTISNKAENDSTELKETVVTDQEISSTDANMGSSDMVPEEKITEDCNDPSLNKTESEPTEDKVEKPNANTAEVNTVSTETATVDTMDGNKQKVDEEKASEDGSTEAEQSTTEAEHSTTEALETHLTSKENINSSDHANSETVSSEVENAEDKNKEQEIGESIDTTSRPPTEVNKSDDPPCETTNKIKSADTSTVDTNNINKTSEKTEDNSLPMEGDNNSNVDDSNKSNETQNDDSAVPETVVSEKRKMASDDAEDSSAKKPKLDGKQCIRPKGVKKIHKGATFWLSNFRQKLCTCNECISMYKDLNVLFLIDMEDTVFAYETLGKERTAGKPNQYEKGIEALCSLGRIQQIDALTEYNKMRDKLLTFLQSFKEKKEVVTEHDIKTFFAGMKPEKRTDGVYFCR